MRILIVSEGSKTEPLYFNEIRVAYRLQTANVAVRACEFGTAPIQVVPYAKELFENGDRHKDIQRRAFEQVYAVFDRDEHRSYSEALQMAESLDRKLRNDARQPVTLRAIASVPCCELWLLLYFEDILEPVQRDEVIQRLRRHIPGYEKGADRTFESTRARLAMATQRAESLAERFDARTDPEPYSGVVDLVKLLTTLRELQSDS